MRFYYVALAIVATLLSSTNAITLDGETNQILQTAPKIVGATQVGTVKRSLRIAEKEVDSLDSLEDDSLDSLEDSEERGLGITPQKLKELAKEKNKVLPVSMDNLDKRLKETLLGIMQGQGISQKKFATKLGLSSVDDTVNRNAAFFKAWKDTFRAGKKPKKIPEEMIGGPL